ncbi:MAG TPA: 1-(5-phosphoribosyl)-5-[(5-phosphoribosylamino)methylideneamino]imidazole-4-carboxamide isomerase [Acidobacteriota bacterium]|nr:1-(5-phosphoribosyl)-5-[(5-phosphoribosylamino)methylideneamino]imidazole-4-carboxamide isomerase [Acidobacteriota bacterium]
MLVIPAIDLIGGRCVRLYQGDYQQQRTYSEAPVDQARLFESAGFRRIHVIDLEGAREGSGVNREVIGQIARGVKIRVQTGGGIRSGSDVQQLLDSRVSYLILGTSVLEDPKTVAQWMERWGESSFIASLDLRDGKLKSHGWLEESDVTLEQAVERIEKLGFPEIICTDIASDGTLQEPNYATYESLRELLPTGVLLLAAGGISAPAHVTRLQQAGVSGAIVGRAMYEGDYSLEEWADAG